MEYFWPEKVYFEPQALDYELGAKLHGLFKSKGIPVFLTSSHNRLPPMSGHTVQQRYMTAKKTLAVGVKKSLRFETCRPSADYEVAFGTSCPGGCEYCYLATTLGRNPYVRVYVNVDEIFDAINNYVEKKSPAVTTFEAASSSDPVAVEHFTGTLARAITYFGANPFARLRLVTKFTAVDTLLNLPHHQHTRFRFSINTDKVIRLFEHNTSPFIERIKAAHKIFHADYPLGFIIAPIMADPGWREDYTLLLTELQKALNGSPGENLSFELISHRYTRRAKQIILERYPQTKLNMNEAERRPKYGAYGYLKYIYPPQTLNEIKTFFYDSIPRFFPKAIIEYFT